MNDEYRIEEPKKGKLKILTLAVILAIVLVLSFLIYFFTKVNESAGSNIEPVGFQVEKGDTARAVAFNLAEAKSIRSPWIFIFYIYSKGAQNKIQAGDYLLDPKASIAEIAEDLTGGRVVSTARNLTVIEGWSNKQIADYLVQRQIIQQPEEFLKLGADHEGYLFPDTYKLGKQEGAAELIKKMLANFETVTKDLKLDKDKIILASIIEKEVGRNKQQLSDEDIALMQKERELVASVFYNRLEIGMALESDATVNYVTGKADRSVSIADTKVKSPYNTYQVRGLPPGPIGNPGLGSLKAAVTPAESDYLFFLNAPDGTAYFGKTLEEHDENREKYLK